MCKHGTLCVCPPCPLSVPHMHSKHQHSTSSSHSFKGILHQKKFYRLNRLVIRWDLEGQRKMINHWSVLSVRRPSKPHGAAPPNPIALCLETPAPPLQTPSRCASKPQVRRASKPLGTKFETKIFKFWWFLGPSDQNELYHTPLLSKIWDLGDRKFFGGRSL